MAAVGPRGPGPDLYQLLAVPREASREEIAQAWRRRARTEHPDSRLPGPSLRAGPVRVEGPRGAPAPSGQDEDEIRLAILTGLALRYLAREWDQPW